MTNSHLILHLVRGQPAFDIAEPATIDDEDAWIISTSGHRAYPYWSSPTPIRDILSYYDLPPKDLTAPPNWPDHYQVNFKETGVTFTRASALLASLGLGAAPIKRRKI